MGICIIHSFNVQGDPDYKITAVDRLIMQRSNPLVHTEWQFSQRYDQISFSATRADGSNCCRFSPIKYSSHLRWVSQYLALSDEAEDMAYNKAKALEGKPYDLVGLASFVSSLNIIKEDPDAYWCSEAVGELLKAAFDLVWLKPAQYSPTTFYFMVHQLLNKGY
jgi:hypothetical protein